MSRPAIEDPDLSEKLRDLTDVCTKYEKHFAAFARKTLQTLSIDPTPADVEDILSDAYLRAALRLRRDESLMVRNYAAWFRRFVFYGCLKHAKKAYVNRVSVTDDDLDEMVENGRIHDEFFDPEANTLRRDIQGILTQGQYEILHRSAEGYSSKEIAEMVNKSPENVRQVKHRALRMIKQKLGL